MRPEDTEFGVKPETSASTRQWTIAWVGLALALAFHVLDEAANDFLGVWNPLVRALRERVPLLPLPTFSFGLWLAGLVAGIVLLLILSRWVRRGARWMIPVSYIFAVMMCGNGLLHAMGTLWQGRAMPGVYSAPLLVIAAIYLFIATHRYRAATKSRTG